MINKYVAMGLGALIALAPVAALAPTKGHTGSHRGHHRRKGQTAQHRARASAHHVHKKMTAPAAAPKS
jgi:hypothetical protein